jgi:hypothetical protein
MCPATTSDQMRRGTGACGGGAGVLGATRTGRRLRCVGPAHATVGVVIAATLAALSVKDVRSRAGLAGVRSQSGAVSDAEDGSEDGSDAATGGGA